MGGITGAVAVLLLATLILGAACSGDDPPPVPDTPSSTPGETPTPSPSLLIEPAEPLDERAQILDYFDQPSLRICVDSESGTFDSRRLVTAFEEAITFGDATIWNGTWLESEPIEIVAGCPAGIPPTVFQRVIGDTSQKFSIFAFLLDQAVDPLPAPIVTPRYEVVQGSVTEPAGDRTIANAMHLESVTVLDDSAAIALKIADIYGSPGVHGLPSFTGQDYPAICVDNPSATFDNLELRDAVIVAIEYGFRHFWEGSYLQQPFEVVAGCPLEPRPRNRQVDRLSSRFSIYIFVLTAPEAEDLKVRPGDPLTVATKELVLLDDSHDPEVEASKGIYLRASMLASVERLAATISLIYGLEPYPPEPGECESPPGQFSVDYCDDTNP